MPRALTLQGHSKRHGPHQSLRREEPRAAEAAADSLLRRLRQHSAEPSRSALRIVVPLPVAAETDSLLQMWIRGPSAYLKPYNAISAR